MFQRPLPMRHGVSSPVWPRFSPIRIFLVVEVIAQWVLARLQFELFGAGRESIGALHPDGSLTDKR
jgi:hypothetical protein